MKVQEDRTPEEMQSLLAAAKNGDAWAQCQLGAVYATGSSGEIDVLKSLDWYRRAAEQDFGEAQYNLGLMHVFGEGVEKDVVIGLQWLEKAAENRQPDAEQVLGEIFEQGAFGIPCNLDLAVKWYTASANHGNAKAKYCLGLLFMSGKGVPKDEAKGRQLVQQAADAGYRYADLPSEPNP